MAHIDLFNDRQTMQKHRFEIFRYRDSYLNEVALHHHDFYEIYLFLNGNVTYSVESRNYTLLPGDVLLLSPLELHRPIISPAKRPYERIVLWLDAAFVEQFCTSSTNLMRCFDTSLPNRTNLVRPSDSKRGEITDLMNTLLYENINSTYGSDIVCLTSILDLLVLLNRLASFDSRQSETTDKSAAIIGNALKYIGEHFSEDLSLDDIAAQFFISKYHLSHEFNRLVGTSVYRYIIQKRLIIAKQLLNDGVPPTVAYEKCGFGDYANFYRAFKTEYGINPKEYVKRSK